MVQASIHIAIRQTDRRTVGDSVPVLLLVPGDGSRRQCVADDDNIDDDNTQDVRDRRLVLAGTASVYRRSVEDLEGLVREEEVAGVRRR